MPGERVFVGLGSNLADPVLQVTTALSAMARLMRTRVLNRSSLYFNPPLGSPDQPHYVNAVAELDTALEPHPLLRALHRIEHAQGRVRGEHQWQARSLDLDLLLYGARVLSDDALTLPHPQMHRRAFVIHPLAEIAPEVVVPGHGAVSALAEQLPADSLRRVNEEARV